jgi:hypothetical protein
MIARLAQLPATCSDTLARGDQKRPPMAALFVTCAIILDRGNRNDGRD